MSDGLKFTGKNCSKLLWLVGNLKELTTLEIFRKILKEGDDGFTHVCLPFETVLAAVIQEVLCNSKRPRELRNSLSQGPLLRSSNPGCYCYLFHVTAICSMLLPSFDLRTECFS